MKIRIDSDTGIGIYWDFYKKLRGNRRRRKKLAQIMMGGLLLHYYGKSLTSRVHRGIFNRLTQIISKKYKNNA